jgi:hypothetical protein
MQRVGHLIEPRLRRIAVLSQLADAFVGLLRQHERRLRPIERRLAPRDDLRSGASVDIRELSIGDGLCGERLFVLG